MVQPGVEFDHTNVIDYQPAKASALSQMVENYETLIFEAHSTDYQTPQSLRQLVIDHFAILKVGPALTFALREALFSLAAIEEELVPAKACSGLRQVLENVMLDRPEYWQSHYHGDGNARRLARGYSYSDRVRYYWYRTARLMTLSPIWFVIWRIHRFRCRSSASICRCNT